MRSGAAFGVLLFAACQCGRVDEGLRYRCDSADDCDTATEQCSGGFCVPRSAAGGGGGAATAGGATAGGGSTAGGGATAGGATAGGATAGGATAGGATAGGATAGGATAGGATAGGATAGGATAGGATAGGATAGGATAGGASCSGSCLPAAPPMWVGPVIAYLRDGGVTLPACSGPWGSQLYHFDGLDAGSDARGAPAQCSCSCIPPAPLTSDCSGTVGATWHSGVACAGNIVGSDDIGTCTGKPSSAVSVHFLIQSNPASGSCTAQTFTFRPQPSWALGGRVCQGSLSGASCPSTQVCAPTVPAGARACIVYPGPQTACPFPYDATSSAIQFHAAANDARQCTACGCGTPSVLCGGQFELHSTSTCTGLAGFTGDVITTPCIGVSTASAVRYTPQANSVSCPISGGAPFGEVVETGSAAISLCCL